MPKTGSSQAWRAFAPDELERQYDARASVASFDAEYARYVAASTPMLSDPRRIADLVYDPASGEKLDIYIARPGAPLFLWVHGGYWRALSKQDNAFAARGPLAHGISVAILDYTLAPTARLDEIVRQTRAAVSWLHANAAHHGYDGHRIHVGGSSAGGHLVGMLLAGGWQADFAVPSDIIGVALPLSGLMDIEPLITTKVNTWMQLDQEAAARNSPIRLIPERSSATLIAATGDDETDEFKRQTVDYVAAFKAVGHDATQIFMPEHNHFNIAVELSEPEGKLCQALAKAILR